MPRPASEGAMNRNIATLSKGFVIVSAVGALASVFLMGAPADAQYVAPPAEYIATTEPVYYEGHAAYWYGTTGTGATSTARGTTTTTSRRSSQSAEPMP